MGLILKTGYFAKLKEYQEAGYYPVSISQYPPEFYKGDECKFFAPMPRLLQDYKEGKCDDHMYEVAYRNNLKKHASEILPKLREIANIAQSKGYDTVIFLCFENNEKFCHRHILADYLNETYGMHVYESGLEPGLEKSEDNEETR